LTLVPFEDHEPMVSAWPISQTANQMPLATARIWTTIVKAA